MVGVVAVAAVNVFVFILFYGFGVKQNAVAVYVVTVDREGCGVADGNVGDVVYHEEVFAERDVADSEALGAVGKVDVVSCELRRNVFNGFYRDKVGRVDRTGGVENLEGLEKVLVCTVAACVHSYRLSASV